MRFHPVRAPTEAELGQLTCSLAHRIGRYLERQGLLERDAENSYLVGDELESGPMAELQGASITYRVAVGRQQGRKVFTLRTLPASDEAFESGAGKVAWFSLHAGVATRADQRAKLERLCRYICRPAVAEKRLSLTQNGHVRYELKTPYRDGTTHVIFTPGFLPSALRASLRLFKIAPGDYVSRWISLRSWPRWCRRPGPT